MPGPSMPELLANCGLEEFQTELEAFAAHLVLENQQLQHENKQLNTLLKEYEQTLESVMSKFRGVAVSLARLSSRTLRVRVRLLHLGGDMRQIDGRSHCRRSDLTCPGIPFNAITMY